MVEMRRLLRSERGQTMVETAIVLPVVVFMLVAMVDAGRVFHAWIVVTNSAREGARAGAARQSETVVTTRIETAMNGWLCTDTETTCTTTNVLGSSGTPVQVQVQRDVTLLSPAIAVFWGNVVTLNGDATMQLE
jgi:Flp pilus assembly protein TadG